MISATAGLEIDSQAPNPAYQQLLTDLKNAEAESAALAAQAASLQGALDSSAPAVNDGTISRQEAELGRLELRQQIADDTLERLSTNLEEAAVNADRSTVELTRLDVATEPTYPISPKRYLYLAIGALIGALIGFVWSFLRVQKGKSMAAAKAQGPAPLDGGDDDLSSFPDFPDLDSFDDVPTSAPSRSPQPVGPRASGGDATRFGR